MKVSIILTSYNHAKYIKEAIDSVLNQTFKDFELIIWDDASTDSSWDIIQSYKDDRIKTFRNEETKRGIYGINKSIKEFAQGEYIAIHHSDDVWESTKLEKQVKFLDENRKYGAVFTNVLAINENSEEFKDQSHFYYSIFNQPNRTRYEWLNYFFYKGNALCHPSVMIRKECYEECGVYRYGLAQIGDFDMWIRLCMKYEIYILSEKLTRFRIRDNETNASGNTPSTRIRRNTEYMYILKNFLKIKKDDFKKVFINIDKYTFSNKKYSKKYIFSRLCIEEQNSEMTKLFGILTLYKLLNNKKQSLNLKKYYNFDYKTLIENTSKYDIFNNEQKPGNFIELYINTEECLSNNHPLKQYVFPFDNSQYFSFDLSSVENINSIRLDPLSDSCIIIIEDIVLTYENQTSINATNLIQSNCFRQYKNVLFFDDEDSQITFKNNVTLEKLKSLEVKIKYLKFGKEAYKVCLNILKQEKVEVFLKNIIENKNSKLVFLGASSALEKNWENLKSIKVIPDYICDNDKSKLGKTFKDYKITDPNQIFDKEIQFNVLITSSYESEIKEQLKDYSNIQNILSIKDLFDHQLPIFKESVKAIFMHIRKTAGTSLVDLLKRVYGNDNTISHGDFITKENIEEYRKIPFISGHFGFDFFSRINEDRFSFVFLREPRDRIISLYFYLLNEDITEDLKHVEMYKLARNIDFHDFLLLAKTDKRVKPLIYNYQVFQLALGFGHRTNSNTSLREEELLEIAINNLNSFNYVGFTETYENDKEAILFELGAIPPNYSYAVNKTPNRIKLEDLSQETLSLLDELVYFDNILYQVAWDNRKKKEIDKEE